LDPGSLAFEKPEKYGYRVEFSDLEGYRRALVKPAWKYTLNYRTRWMTKDEIVESTYESAHALNVLKLQHGLIEEEDAQRIAQRILLARDILRRMDRIMSLKRESDRVRSLRGLKEDIEKANKATLCPEKELRWVPEGIGLRKVGILKSLIKETKRKI
jgi:hypothetical protein